MKCKCLVFALILCSFVCGFTQDKKDSVARVNATGSIKVQVKASGNVPGMEDKSWEVTLYSTGWQVVKKETNFSSASKSSQDVILRDVAVGQYYVSAWAATNPNYLSHPWLFEYYNNSPDQGGASTIQVNASDTTRITMELDQTTYITIATNPNKGFQFTVDGKAYTAPKTFEWRKSDAHTIGVNEYYDLPSENNIRCYFREWRHGGSRVQSYTVPSPKFFQFSDTLVARFDYKCKLDIVSKYGNPKPKASDWYPAWQNVTISVENSVIQYSDGTFAFRKASAGKDSVRHLFDRWTGTGYGSYSGKNNPATFLLNANTVETALWKDQFPLVAQSNDTSMGTVSANPKGVWQNRDTTVVLTAVPKKGYGFVKWEGSKTDTTKILSVKMDTSKTLTAKFERLNPVGTIKALVYARGKGLLGFEEKNWSVSLYNTGWTLVKGSGVSTSAYLTESVVCLLKDIPPGNYYLGAGASISYMGGGGSLPRDPWLFEYFENSPFQAGAALVTVNAFDTTRVTVELDWTAYINLATSPLPFQVTVDGIALTPPKTLSWRKSEVHTIGLSEYYELPGKSDVRWYFREWRHGGSRNQSYTVPDPKFRQNADSLLARFVAKYRLTVQSNDTTMGTVTVRPAGVWQARDTTVVLTAVPKKGYGFVKWEGSKTDTTKILSVKMDTSKTLTAKFALSTAVVEKQKTGRNPGDPLSFELYQNYPNPFNPSTEIRFDVPEPGKVTIEIFMLMGKRLKVLAETEYAPGSYRVTWDGTDAYGQKVGSGIYICRMGAGNNIKFIKLSLIK